jgi:hypothetical protein
MDDSETVKPGLRHVRILPNSERIPVAPNLALEAVDVLFMVRRCAPTIPNDYVGNDWSLPTSIPQGGWVGAKDRARSVAHRICSAIKAAIWDHRSVEMIGTPTMQPNPWKPTTSLGVYRIDRRASSGWDERLVAKRRLRVDVRPAGANSSLDPSRCSLEVS